MSLRKSRLLRVGAAVLVACALTSYAGAADVHGAADAIRHTLEARFPEVRILEIKPAPMPHLYEVMTEGGIVYSDETGDYLIQGSLMQTNSKRNLTAESMDAHNSIDFKALPFDHAIKIVKGNGKRRLVVFADPDCPYCQKLERELQPVTNVTIYTFLYPLDELHPQASERARAIWCAPNRGEAWTQWVLEHKQPPDKGSCKQTPLEENAKLAQNFGINATPTLFTSNGHRISGVRTADKLEVLLSQATP